MIDHHTFEQLLPAACNWAYALEEFVLARGIPLSPGRMADATLVGVQDPARIRVLVVDRIPLPDDPELAEAARRNGIITDETRCIGFGHALIIRGDAWNDRELILHNLIHIAQCERSGGLEQWVRDYLCDRATCADFTLGSFEAEARERARELCAANMPGCERSTIAAR